MKALLVRFFYDKSTDGIRRKVPVTDSHHVFSLCPLSSYNSVLQSWTCDRAGLCLDPVVDPGRVPGTVDPGRIPESVLAEWRTPMDEGSSSHALRRYLSVHYQVNFYCLS